MGMSRLHHHLPRQVTPDGRRRGFGLRVRGQPAAVRREDAFARRDPARAVPEDPRLPDVDLPQARRAELRAMERFGSRGNPRGAAAMCFRGDVYQGLEAWTMSSVPSTGCRRTCGSSKWALRTAPAARRDPALPARDGHPASDRGRPRPLRLLGRPADAHPAQGHEGRGADTLVNLASDEYSKAARLDELGADVLDVKFMQKDGGSLRFISFFAKRARGLMARWMADHRPHPRGPRGFDVEGYRFHRGRAPTA